METQKIHSPTQTEADPSQIWHTLTVTQQETVLQTVVRICSRLNKKKKQGGPDESQPSP